MWDLIKATPSLDDNSVYCNLLQTSHFAETCAIAERDGKVVGWASGYVRPDAPDTLFIWQVCVSDSCRGLGLGRRLIADILARPACRAVTRLECTITEENSASWALFTSIARRLDAQMRQVEQFTADLHFDGRHDTEYGVTIGPFRSDRALELAAA